MDVTSCRQENGAYVLCGDTYADACLMLTDEEKRRLDNGVTATVTYTGMEGPCTLQKAGKTDTGQEYLLTNGQAYGMILVESQDEGQTGWVLSDPDSGMAWHPLLKTGGTITVPADTPVEVNNYYAYYDSFRNDFTMDVPDANGGQGQQWAMQLYYEYLVNVEQMAKEGHWGGMLAKIHITQKDGRMQLADMYLP